MLIGDGVSDLVARSAVDLMVGFGGVVTRQRVIAEAGVFIKSNSLASILPLALTETERVTLASSAHAATLNKGLALIQTGGVIFNQEQINDL